MNSEQIYFNNLPEMLETSASDYNDKEALSFVNGISYSYTELYESSLQIATALYGVGIEKGDNIALIGENSPHWAISYFGIQKSGGVVVPVLTDFTSSEMNSVLDHSGACMVFITKKQLSKFPDGLPGSVKYIVTLEDLVIHDASSFNLPENETQTEYLKVSSSLNKEYKVQFPEVNKDDLAVIIYTSGTTGSSKGVMLSHDNLISNAVHTGSVHQVVNEDVFLSVLPLAHTYECTIGLLIPILNGASVYYVDRAPTASYLAPLLQQIKPTTMLTVPLIIEKIYRNKIKPELQKSAVTRNLVKFGPTRKLIHRAAGKKLMNFFGGKIRFYGVGGAPLAPDVEKFLIEAKFPYAIGYGLTETSPMLAGFGPDDCVYRSVGKAMEGIDLMIYNPDENTGEGEIVAKGRNIMKGYYKNEALTEDVFTEDGYFRTGDLGIIDRKGIIYIKGRSKNMILGPNGENIYPEEIESVINKMEFVSESLVLQAKGKLTARIHINLENLEEKVTLMKENAQERQKELILKAEELLEELRLQVNQHLNKNSRLQVVILQVDPFEKTATQKIKRFLYNN